MSATFSIHVHADGSKKAYEIFGQEHLGKQTPLVLVNVSQHATRRLAEALRCALSVSPSPGIRSQVFDHRGMGDSTFSTKGDERLTLEMMARDLLDLIVALNWKKIVICGSSMGAQQLLVLPFHPSNPAALPFEVSHIFLTATLCEPQQDTSKSAKRFRSVPPPAKGRKRTFEETREFARPTTTATFDPKWVAENPDRFNCWLDRMTAGGRYEFVRFLFDGPADEDTYEDLYEPYANVTKDTKIMVIHGKLDEVLPYSASRVILERLPWAKDAEVGDKPGQIPSLDFGRHWFEYFDIEVWKNIFEVFLNEPPPQSSDLAGL
ncbi:hypothetical protein EST38_g6874 [Candolleomyces aberdarensis]|uniref:AB hydrolase-1 domain-containing protein n=1 Tax=Candolleomyces aberdarensis TaxID=2316362 RepID=A0A4Q2DGK6_9AGAR|nr:hypothetical protein EST38_g6874 [Candolleomyces aberdarensis]